VQARSAAARLLGSPNRANSVYLIAPDGLAERLVSLPRTFIFSLAADAQGRVFAGTGNEGKVYTIEGKAKLTSVADEPESQVLCVLAAAGSLAAGTGNTGAVYRFGTAPGKSGWLESSVHDAGGPARWGKIQWRQRCPKGASVTFQTRSGNSRKPDNTWSDWSKPCTDASGTPIASPPGRFIQYRASLAASQDGQSPQVSEAAISYLPSNRPPEIASLTVGAPAPKPPTAPQKPGASKPSSPKPPPAPSRAKITISWKATDPNGDKLRHSLYFRGEDEEKWKLLKDKLDNVASYVWDTRRVPDGRYVVRLVSSDELSNPASLKRSAERVSPPFVIDNTPPAVRLSRASVQGSRSVKLGGIAQDDSSAVARAEYSIDAQDWVTLFPEDGIFDSRTERFLFTTTPLSPGEHTLVVVASDSSGNIGSAKAVVRVK